MRLNISMGRFKQWPLNYIFFILNFWIIANWQNKLRLSAMRLNVSIISTRLLTCKHVCMQPIRLEGSFGENSLPDSVKNATSVDVFKSRLKSKDILFGIVYTL